jgi:sensor c-di-GMP phosphodiesterase-like protein
MPELLEELRQLLAAHGVKPESVAIEITESAAAHDSELIAEIQQLRAMGHPIHLDDFGTGYSSLSYLHELRIDAIKIDRAFMRAIGTHSVQVDILPQIISIAQKLNLDVVVEGIETLAAGTGMAVWPARRLRSIAGDAGRSAGTRTRKLKFPGIPSEEFSFDHRYL